MPFLNPEGGVMGVTLDTERNTRFMNLLEEWQTAEDDIIVHCQKMDEATDNAFIKALADIIKTDSLKHKEILAMIGEATKGNITLGQDELGDISGLIAEHLEIERKSISLALMEFENSSSFVVQQLLFYLLEDERKHFMLLTMLNEYERKTDSSS